MPNYRTKKPQTVKAFGGEKTMIFIGRCQECNNTVYGFEGDENPDPRGLIAANHCASDLVASEYGFENGSDVHLCWTCRDDSTRNAHAEKIARAKWEAESKTYTIIRYYSDNRPNEVIKTGLTLAEATEHCNDKSTREPGKWFDGRVEE